MQYFTPEPFWGRLARARCAVDAQCGTRVALVMIDLALLLVAIDLLAPPNVIVVAAEPMLMAAGAWLLSRMWSHRLLGVMAIGFAILLLSGDEYKLTVGILFAVTCLFGLTAFELSDAVNQRRRFLGYLEDQLRSPVTLIRGYVSMANEGDIPAEVALAQVDRAAEMLGRMLEGALSHGKRLAGAQLGPPPIERLAHLRLHRSAQHYEVVWHGIGHRTTARVRTGGEPGSRARSEDQPPVSRAAAS